MHQTALGTALPELMPRRPLALNAHHKLGDRREHILIGDDARFDVLKPDVHHPVGDGLQTADAIWGGVNGVKSL